LRAKAGGFGALDGGLAAVPFQNAGCTEPLGLIYRKNKILTPAMTTFIQFLKQPAAMVN
jgi:DNA-binding transcriptional LysR family regulator